MSKETEVWSQSDSLDSNMFIFCAQLLGKFRISGDHRNVGLCNSRKV